MINELQLKTLANLYPHEAKIIELLMKLKVPMRAYRVNDDSVERYLIVAGMEMVRSCQVLAQCYGPIQSSFMRKNTLKRLSKSQTKAFVKGIEDSIPFKSDLENEIVYVHERDIAYNWKRNPNE